MRMQRQTIILQSNIRKTIDYYNQMELAQIEIFGILQTMLSSRESTAHSPSLPRLFRANTWKLQSRMQNSLITEKNVA